MRNQARSHESIRGNSVKVAVSGPALLRAALDSLIAKDTAFVVVEQANADVIIEVKVIPVPGDPAFIASYAVVRGRDDPEAFQAEFLGLHEPADLLMSSISLVAARSAGDNLVNGESSRRETVKPRGTGAQTASARFAAEPQWR